jgi:ribosome-binding protein aMBF1 (putative translation factor)
MSERNTPEELPRTHILSENLPEAFPDLMRREALRIMRQRELSDEKLAKMLGIFPAGVRRLVEPESWPASTGFRVLEALGVTIELDFKSPDQT